MSAAENGASQPQQPLLSVGTFLRSPGLPEEVRRYQLLEKSQGRNKPVDVALAEMIMQTGRIHIHSVMAACHVGEDNNEFLTSQHAAIVESFAAVAFGISYLALHEFLTTARPDDNGNRIFNNADFLASVDREMFDTPQFLSLVFPNRDSLSTPERIISADWDNMTGVARDLGFAALMNGYKMAELPGVVIQLIQGLDTENRVPEIVERFQGALIPLENPTERTARINSIPTSRLSDDVLRTLLGDDLAKYL